MKNLNNLTCLLLFMLCLFRSSFTKTESPKIVDNLNMVRFLSGKKFFRVDPSKIGTLSDDQFLERIQFDYTLKCLSVKDSLCTIEDVGFSLNFFCITRIYSKTVL